MSRASEAKSAIEQILQEWPRSIVEPEEILRHRLQGKIDPGLTLESLRTVPIGKWRTVSNLLLCNNRAKCLVVDSMPPGTRVLVESHYDKAEWTILRFDAECPVCFGLGLNGADLCNLCFGIGWGTKLCDESV